MVKKYTLVILSLLMILNSSFILKAENKIPYVENNIENAEINTESLNIRKGAGINFPVIGKAQKGQKVQVLGVLGEWYLVYFSDGTIGVVSSEFVSVENKTNKTNKTYNNNLISDKEILQQINYIRKENNLQPILWDEKLNEIASLKAHDMSQNKYLSHNSKKYGTPFDMLRDMGISYKYAAENIIVCNNTESSYELLYNEKTKINILNTGFQKMGIGIADSDEYGKIIVEIYIRG